MFEKIAYSTDLGEIAMINALLKGEGIEVPELFRSPHVSIAGSTMVSTCASGSVMRRRRAPRSAPATSATA